MAKKEFVTVRLERQPNRRALERLREAYQRLQQAGQWMSVASLQEDRHETDRRSVCPGIDPAAGAGSHD
jgi:hypothetical protein